MLTNRSHRSHRIYENHRNCRTRVNLKVHANNRQSVETSLSISIRGILWHWRVMCLVNNQHNGCVKTLLSHYRKETVAQEDLFYHP